MQMPTPALSLDGGVHIVEIIVIIFWMGASYRDLAWVKEELRYLRGLCDTQFGISRRIERNTRP